MVSTRRGTIICATIALLALAAVLWVDRFGRGSRVFGPVGTIQAQNIVKREVDDPTDAYRIWKEAGYRGRTIVYVSDRWESFDPGTLAPVQMFRDYPLQLYNTPRYMEENQLNGVTFLYVAALNRICRRIVAIVPESEVGRMREATRTSKDARMGDNGLFVSREGFPRWFTTGAAFRGAGEPVLLYVGASYFRTAEPAELLRQLTSTGLQTDCVVLCNEAGKPAVTPAEIARLNTFARLIGLSPPPAGSGATSTMPMQEHTISPS